MREFFRFLMVSHRLQVKSDEAKKRKAVSRQLIERCSRFRPNEFLRRLPHLRPVVVKGSGCAVHDRQVRIGDK